ncbi:NADH:ubiquinone oxidoreductase subunit NDUFA12 [Nisaea sp.]|uniref:NADH:ubiquinone oxidoreductase subunit NDUFA12 n=1 Tax=Nisaea sp. TaxID=2024842 RepID=UPI003B52F920
MNIGTAIYTWLNGREVGQDQFGNRYFEHKSEPARGQRRKRWVIYKGIDEASKVPAEWHAWLHYTAEAPLAADQGFEWQKEHLPNLTGTRYAYRPPGHVLEGGKRAPATGDYEAWTPN